METPEDVSAGGIDTVVIGVEVRDGVEVPNYRQGVSTTSHLQPFLNTIPELPADFDLGLFEATNLSETSQQNPYAPIMQFITLLHNSETHRVFDTLRVNPIFVDEIRDQIRSGMATDAIYPPAVVEDITSTYPDATESLLESGQLTLSTHDALPFGLAIFDDRIGLGGYDPDSGLLSAFVDTDDPDARAWALALFDRYRASAAPGPTPRG